MLEILNAPETVVAVRATGRVDENDIQRAIDAIEAALARQDRITLYAELDMSSITPAALARDMGYAFTRIRELHRTPRAAVVTSQEWVRWITQLEKAFLPGIEVRTFMPAEKDAALAWASEPLPKREAEPEPAGPGTRPIPTSRPDVIAFEIDGRIGSEDVQRLIALFNEAMDSHERLRVLVRVRNLEGVDPAALGQEGLFETKLKGLSRIERYALVGGPTWMEGIVVGLAPFLGPQTRRFRLEEEAEAWKWLEAEPA